MKNKIDKFIRQQTCASACCVDEYNNPYCFSCFYSYDAKESSLYYKSSAETRHSAILLTNPVMAGTITPDRLNLLQIQGVQFEGIVLPPGHPSAKHASGHYHKKHPVALTIPGQIWTIQLNVIKFTDNTLGFGTKLYWSRIEMSPACK
jgi:uncharacterized protein YhbP (UPF0306 family)